MNTKQAAPEHEGLLTEADYRELLALIEGRIDEALDRAWAELMNDNPSLRDWLRRWLRGRPKRRRHHRSFLPAVVRVGSSMPSSAPAPAAAEAPVAATAGVGAVAAPTGGGVVTGT